MGSLSGGNNVSDLIMLVDNKVPIITFSALQDAENKMVKVVDSSFRLDNLLVSLFLNTSGKIVKISSEIL